MSAKLKNAIKAINKSALICGSLGSLALSGAVFAQDSGLVEEEVVVTGIRGSLQASVDIKRASTSVVDAVSAEDIGKFPDSDVAEALGRIPGVAVNRQFGQGQQVSIRGASNQLTLTTLNGQNVASTGWYDQQSIDRSFNYTLLPPEMIAGIEVFKSSQANLVEGGIGGTVNVKTRKPLDLDAHTVFLSAEAAYGTVSEEVDPQLSGMYSFKTDNEVFGILVAGAWQDSEYHRLGTESLYGWNAAVSVNNFQQQRERTAFDLSMQVAPSEGLQFGLHYMNLELVADNTNSTAFIFQQLGTDNSNCDEINARGVCTLVTNDADNVPVNTYFQTFARAASMDSETIDLDFSYEGDWGEVTARLGKTESEGGTDLTTNYGNFIGVPSDVYGTIDARGDEIKLSLADAGWTVADINVADADGNAVVTGANTVLPSGWAEKSQPNTDEETYFQVDTSFNVEFNAINTIKAGIRTTSHEVTDKTLFVVVDADGYEARSASNYWGGTVPAGMQGYAVPNPNFDAMHAYVKANQVGWAEDRAGYGTIEEDNQAAYVMAEFESEGVSGNFGLRYVKTEASSDYYVPEQGYETGGVGGNNNTSETIATQEAEYSDVLPSINVKFELTDSVVLRTSAAQVISRPNYVDMFAKTSLAGLGDNSPANQTLTTGSVGLKPFKATQADVSVEWYYGDANMLSLTYFKKDVSNFTTFENIPNQEVGIVDTGCNCDDWTVITKKDGSGGEIDGFEVQWQHTLDSGFGGIVNYTYANANAEPENFNDRVGVFTDSSENTLNLVGFYENDLFSARAAYNWRSEYMIRESGFYGNRMHDDFGTFDLSFSVQPMDMIGITFDIVNLLEEDSIQTGAASADAGYQAELSEGYPTWTYEGEARYILGVNFRF
ncbi:TonB-dependent receptor [Teredinibacter sp. KSP-S5-2]|uniref:TonB-dependent receptor n=1 Tax=Teredinibacter sp. KSP-S5-2 TaxID=3034506 RepID=UPI002934379B|nr:TonB-dependent receptor [Teredinibacter sp. KSP-S5-2]WNO09262.1 TonB-dependent receptor [Teredinibacter sp. KSP-S5-2]